ncbi:guanyl nucleotide exchange factor Sql2 [Cryptococcus gattii EJB2]|uniref:Guanyl nucleotide exchange factor Sql2 n=1 Tax=Cryptococcus gattii EJB2 TaxID=1296103 RepID=A0ABR5BT00_9TREE|nr:guanyl nucleotide exchange factor Sql2 [Cryptococcus gattii EJB2]
MTDRQSTPASPISASPKFSHAQAIHDFDPSLIASTSSSSSNLYLSFKAGEIIRVHVRDPTGWWDGEITSRVAADNDGRTLRRGWFPSNYIREIDWDPTQRRAESSMSVTSPRSPYKRTHSRHGSVASHQSNASSSSISQIITSPRADIAPLPAAFQILIQPIVQSLSLLDTAIHNNRKSHIQPSTACVISSIRAALSQTDCLSKESQTLVSWPVLAKERKVVLVELSRLVGCARTASGMTDSAGDTSPGGEMEDLEELAKSARGVFQSVKRFLNLAHQCGVQVTLDAQNEGVPMSVSSSASSEIASVSALVNASAKTRASPGSNARLQEAFHKRVASIGDLRAAKQRSESPPPPPTGSSQSPKHTHTRTASKISTPISAAFSDVSSPLSSRPFEHRIQGSMDSLFSQGSPATSEKPHAPWEDRTSVPTATVQPSTPCSNSIADIRMRISYAEDTLLSIIAAFIGHIHSHHIHSHPSSHSTLIEMTRETIDAVRTLLTAVETVGRNASIRSKRPKEIESLRIAKDRLYDVAGRLVESAEIVANSPFEEIIEEGYEKEKAELLGAATGTLRAGTECVRLVRICVPEDETINLNATPKQTASAASEQLTPRIDFDNPVVERGGTVGVRGPHTLSSLHRKATSLDHLQKRFMEDGGMVPGQFYGGPQNEFRQEEEEEEEEVIDEKEEDRIKRPSQGVMFPPSPDPSSQEVQLYPTPRPSRPPHELLRGFSETGRRGPRVRSTSLSTSPTPRVGHMGHRSPSRSADLDKFTSGEDLKLGTDVRPREAGETRDRWEESESVTVTSNRLSVYTSISSLPSLANTDSSAKSASENDDQSTPVWSRKLPHGSLRVVIPKGISNQMSELSLQNSAEEPVSTARTSMTLKTLPSRPATFLRTQTSPMPVISYLIQSPTYSPADITYNPDGNMVGASLAVLVEKMTPHDGHVDPNFSSTFFYTFRLFTTPADLLEAVQQRWYISPPEELKLSERDEAIWRDAKVMPIRIRIFNFLRTWLEFHWQSEVDNIILDDLEKFGREEVGGSLPVMGERLVNLVQRKKEGREDEKRKKESISGPTSASSGTLHPPAVSSLPPTPIISKNLHSLLKKSTASFSSSSSSSVRIHITEFDTLELARQLTIIVSKMFRQLEPEDLLMTGKKTVPELKGLSTHSNQVTGWVADSILNEGDAKRRAALLKFFIKLADKCLLINNFFTMFAVLGGLNSSTILRLKKTWDALSVKYKVLIERLRGIIEHTKNHAAYRARLKQAPTPCLPFLGLILTDITFTSDGNPSTRPSNSAPDLMLINYDKFAKLGKIAIEFRRYQEPFNFHELEAVQTFLHTVLTERGSGSIDALYRKSCRVPKSYVLMSKNQAG